ncbi:MAG: hypothetical protein IJW23_12860 [Lentisphaeria bacterium]|nr:hypothetical protein [Lentisphaeria bacterium]
MKRLIPCLLLAISLPLAAQFSLDSKNREGKPILINSDAMDVEIEKGIATFYGNVVINDPDFIITCNKMVLYQAPKDKNAKKPAKKKDPNDPLGASGAKLDRIECIDNVVITRKNTGDKSQWGTCGKAIYFHKEGKITMMIDPVLYQDDSKITGIRLTFFRDSKRIEGTDIKITARNLSEEDMNPKNPAKKKNAPVKKTDADAVDNFYNRDNDNKNDGGTDGKNDGMNSSKNGGSGKNSDTGVQGAPRPQREVPRKISQKEVDTLLGLDSVPDKDK